MRALILVMMLTACSAVSSDRAADAADEPRARAPIDPQLEREMRDVPVAMYMTNWCPVCQKARNWLARNGFEHVEFDVEVDVKAGRIHRSLNPRGTVPMFDVDGTILIGFSPYLLRDAIRQAAAERRTTMSLQ